jgi:hypothetical protein
VKALKYASKKALPTPGTTSQNTLRYGKGVKAQLNKNLPFPLFAKEGNIASLWQREVRRDFINNATLVMVLSVKIRFKLEKDYGTGF